MQYPPLTDWRRYPVTVGIAAGAVAMTARVWLGASDNHLTMSDAFWHGELWQPLTSCLLHGSVLHLLFNLMCLWVFGPVFERIFGSARFLLLVIFLAVGSSLAEYAFSVGGIGLSGVIYGLFGMLWVLGGRDRRFFGTMDQQTVQMLVGWFFLCIALTVAKVMAIGNVAHGSGAILGGLLGFAIVEKDKLRKIGYVAGLATLMLAIFAAASVGRPYVNFSGDVERQKYNRALSIAQQGNQSFDAGKFEEAAEFYSRALAIDDSEAAFWYNLGLCRLRLGKPDQACEAFRRAAALEPDNEQYQKMLEMFSPNE